MAAPDTTVKYFHSGMSGAPVLSGTAGALIAVLDACLVNGFGSITLDSLVVAGGIATATRSAGQLFEKGAVVLVAGATPAELNGQKRTLSISGTQFTFDATGISDQTATGTIAVKLAPAGWEKQYSGTNLAAYRSLDAASTHAVLRVDDTATKNARVVGYESMTDVNSGTFPFPTATQQAGGLYWGKSQAADATARKWIVIADARAVFVCLSDNSATAETVSSYFFGDAVALKPADAYSAVLVGPTSDQMGSGAQGAVNGNIFFPGSTGMFLQRDATGLSTSFATSNRAVGGGGGNPFGVGSGTSGTFPTYPSNVHGSVIGSAMVFAEGVGAQSDWRHYIPGVQYLQTSFLSGVFPSKTKFAAEGSMAGRTLYCLEFSGVTPSARAMIDITGPWR